MGEELASDEKLRLSSLNDGYDEDNVVVLLVAL